MTTWSGMLEVWAGSTDPAVVTPSVTWTGEDLLRHAAGRSEWLDSVGAATGVAVPALVTSSPSTFALVIGAAASRRPLAPLSHRSTPRELRGCLEALGAPVLVTDPEHLDVAARAAPEGMDVVPVPEPVAAPHRVPFSVPDDATAFVLHTSGTTGLPKSVPYRQDRMARRAQLCGALASLGPGASFASASPFHHTGGWGNSAYALAVGAALMPVPAFTVESWRELLSLRPTNVLLVTTMVERILAAGAMAEASTVAVFHYGGAQIRPETLGRCMEALPGVSFLNLYGQTEGGPITALTQADHRVAAGGRTDLLASCGRAVDGLELRVADPGPDGIGEVHARAFHLMRPDADGWLRTGDLARIDDDGYLFLSGRMGDRISRGGENVYPQEVERILAEHASVADCAVVGVPDDTYGEQVKAFVVPADPGAPPDVDEVRAWVRSQLAGFKVPTQWELLTELPRNPAGKVLRRQLVADREGKPDA